MRPTVRRRFLPLLLLPLFMLATALAAQDGFTGRFTFAQSPDAPPMMVLELADTGDGLIGIGQTTADMPNGFEAVVTVVSGASFEGNLQLELELEPFSDLLPSRMARFQVIDGSDPVATLILGGQTLHGVLLRVGGAADPVPEATAPVAPDAPTAAEGVCDDLAALTDRLNATATQEVGQIIRGIYTISGLAFGGEQTPEKCAQALAELQSLAAELEEGEMGEGAESCLELEGLLPEVFAMAGPGGALHSDQIARVLADAGLHVPEFGPGGVWNDANCARALPGIEALIAGTAGAETALAPPVSQTTGGPIVQVPFDGFVPTQGNNHIELWRHNDSLMAMETSFGGYLGFWYWEPRAGLEGVGVRPGTLLFNGEISGSYAEGTARLFTGDCGVYDYTVGGNWFEGAPGLTLTGERPVVDGRCTITGHVTDTLQFDFVSFEPAGAAPQGQPQDGTQSTGIVMQPLGTGGADPDDDLGEFPEIELALSDVPGFGVWAEVYEVYDVSQTLNMRAGPGTHFGVVAELPAYARDILVMTQGCTPELDQAAYSEMSVADQAQVLSSRWCHVHWNGRVGWVYGRYIRPY